MKLVVVVVNQRHGQPGVGHVEVVVPVSGDDDVLTGADGPSGTVSALIANDGVGVEGQRFVGAGGDLPTRKVNVHAPVVVEFKPLAVGVEPAVCSLRVGDDFVDADTAAACGGTSRGVGSSVLCLLERCARKRRSEREEEKQDQAGSGKVSFHAVTSLFK